MFYTKKEMQKYHIKRFFTGLLAFVCTLVFTFALAYLFIAF